LNTKQNGIGLLPIGVVEAASCGDADAMRVVLSHYGGYILALSVVRLYDEDGVPHNFIDETLRSELELRLVTKVVGFKFKPAA
jgi:hypothetical protein